MDLILTGNGPGELTGWIVPVARAARRLAAERSVPLRITLALSPSQSAGGREPAVVVPPAEVTRLALGLGRKDPINS